MAGQPPAPPAGGRGAAAQLSSPLPPAGGHEPEAPLPPAGGVGGGQFKPRDTVRARALRNAASLPERTLWRAMSGRKLEGFKFSRQVPVGPYFADFLCREAKLIVELDGFSHETRLGYDQRRDHYLIGQGFRVLRFANAEVMANLEGVVHGIAVALAEKGPPPTPPASGRGEGVAVLPAISVERSVG